MTLSARRLLTICAGLAVLGLVTWLSRGQPAPESSPWPQLLFGVLIVFTTTFGLPAGGGWISLLPMTTVAAFLVMGLAPAAWTVFAASLAHEAIRQVFPQALEVRREPGRLGPFGLAAANASINTLSIVAAGAVFELTGGQVPLTTTALRVAPQLFLLSVTYLVCNHGLAAIHAGARGRRVFGRFWDSLPRLVIYEGGPLVFASLMAVIYTRLGPAELARFSILLIVATLVVRDLGMARRRLERRLTELDTLQTVSQALSASLDLETILWAIHAAVSRLTQAGMFYVALYDRDRGEVAFPLVVGDGERIHWRTRPPAQGLAEWLLGAREPLLIRREVEAELGRLGLAHSPPAPASWLGVPLLAGGEALGAIAVESRSEGEWHVDSDRDLLATIASQAAVAIQNARLYAQTDAALARRVRELDSILQTADEGILLVDLDLHALAANRALAGFAGLALSDFVGDLTTAREGDLRPLVALIGYGDGELRADCRELLEGGAPAKKREIVLAGPPERYVARTLAPVRDAAGAAFGWLLVFRDLTEERELARLRDDLAHMLIHDLRAPAAVLKGSLDMIRNLVRDNRAAETEQLVGMAREGTERLLGLINQLLDVSQLESGQLQVQTEALEVEPLLRDVAGRLDPLASQARIAVEVSAEPGLPLLEVDPELIGRVLTNLLDNAIKFTPDGGRIRLWARAGGGGPADPAGRDGQPGLLVGVTDQGPGIPLEARSRLFRKFEHVHTSTRRAGTGLGLAFCKLVVEAHGGRIWAESQPGHGSTFAMRLPVVA